MERVLRKIAGELKLRKVQSYMEVYGWMGAQLMYHAGEVGAFFILRHLIYKMRLYDQAVFEANENLVI